MRPDLSSQHTFVVLAYGDSPYLGDCVQSLLSQTWKSKILISTSAPTENQRKLALEHNLPYFINSTRSGIAGDWNFALAAADTRYVTLVHQDDLYDENYLESMMAAMVMSNDVSIAFSDYLQLDTDGIPESSVLIYVKKAILVLSFPFRKVIRSGLRKRLLVSFGCPICCPTVMYNRDQIGEKQFDASFDVNLDWKCWIDLARTEGSFVYVPKKLLSYRAHQQTTTQDALSSGRRKEEDRRCFDLLWPRWMSVLLSKLYAISYTDSLR